MEEVKLTRRFVINTLLILAALWLAFKIPVTLLTFGCGLVLYFIFDPPIRFLEKYLKSRGLTILVVLVLFTAAMTILLWLFFPPLINQLEKFSVTWPQYYGELSGWVEGVSARLDNYLVRLEPQFQGQIQSQINNLLNSAGQWLFQALEGSFNFGFSLISKILTFLLGILVAVYLLLDEKKIKVSITNGFKLDPAQAEKLDQLSKQINWTISNYFQGMTFLSVLLFFLSWGFLAAAGVPYAFLLSVWVGITEYIPYIGPIFGSIPPIILAYMQSVSQGNSTLLFFIVLQAVLANIIAPRVLGKTLNIHPLVVFFALLVGGELFGIVGMLIAVPLASILIYIFQAYLQSR